MSNKETKTKVQPNRDPSFERFDANEFAFSNRLQLPKKLRDILKDENLDYRFINQTEFRANGAQHQSQWQVYRLAKPDPDIQTTPEGAIVRGDLVLGVRSKAITAAHKQFLAKRNAMYAGHTKSQAAELRKMAQRAGAGDQVQIHEGYEDDGKTGSRGSYKAQEDLSDD